MVICMIYTNVQIHSDSRPFMTWMNFIVAWFLYQYTYMVYGNFFNMIT